MKNILLIGDSIRIGYDKAVKNSLEGIANVYFPEDNCRFAAYLLRYLHEYRALLGEGKADLIHFNTGLWDCLRLFGEDTLTPVEFYKYYINRICIQMKKLFPEAKVIFATSTSVISEEMGDNFKRYNEDIEKYNAAALEVIKEHGFAVNDLYSLSLTLPKSAHSDPVHFYTPKGTEAFTKQVLSHIASALEIIPVPEYKEELHTDKPIGI